MSSTPPTEPLAPDVPVEPDEPGALAAPGDEEADVARARLNAGAVLPSLISSAAAVGIALLIGAVVIAFSGDNPVMAYRALVRGAVGDTNGISETLVAAAPLILAGLGFAVAFRAGLFNIGLEGQLILGGLAAGLIATYDLGPKPVHIGIALLAAAVVGGVWSGIAGALKAWTGASEVITTIMLNYLAYRISTWAVGAEDLLPVNAGLRATTTARESARLPRFIEGERVHAGIVIALVAAAALWYVLFKTTYGYRIRTVGLSRGAAAYAGFSWGATITTTMFLSGALAGLAGAGESLGVLWAHYDSRSGLGFTAIAVGLVGRNHPAGVVMAGLLFGALKAGATEMKNTAGTSKELVLILQALVILAIAAFAAGGRLRLGERLRGRSGGPRRSAGQAAASAASPAGD